MDFVFLFVEMDLCEWGSCFCVVLVSHFVLFIDLCYSIMRKLISGHSVV